MLIRATSVKSALPSVMIYESRDEGLLPVLMKELNGEAVLVLSDDKAATILKISADTGEVSAQKQLSTTVSWAAVRGDRLFLRADEADCACLCEYSADDLTLISEQPLDFTAGDEILFDCDEQGNCFYVLSASRKALRGLSGSTATVRDFPDEIEFLSAEADGSLWAYSGGNLYAAEPAGNFAAVEFLGEPYCMMNDEVLLDRSGVLYSLTSSVPKPLFQCADIIYDKLSVCIDSEGCLVVSKTNGNISRSSTDGKLIGSCKLEKRALAVCGLGAVFRTRDGIRFSSFNFADTGTAAPTTEPTPAPTPTPGPDYPPAHAEGDFIYVAPGTTAAELRELFKPEAVNILDKHGNRVYNGRISTGMTAGDWILVTEGDCNGTGTVNFADLKECMRMIIKGNHPELDDDPSDAYHMAADLDHSGIVDLQDAAMLLGMIKEK